MSKGISLRRQHHLKAHLFTEAVTVGPAVIDTQELADVVHAPQVGGDRALFVLRGVAAFFVGFAGDDARDVSPTAQRGATSATLQHTNSVYTMED